MKKSSRYSVGEKVVIDRIFSTVKTCQGSMELIPERMAIIEAVDLTSLGPCYKIAWIDKQYKKSKIKYWESDIKSKYKFVNKTL